MNSQELLTVIHFVDRTRSALGASVPDLGIDSDWAILRTLMLAHLSDQRLAITELIAASGLPYGSGHRRISRLIEQGHIDCQSTRAGAKQVSLAASPALRSSFIAFAHQIKVQVAETISAGITPGDADDFYLGARRSPVVDIVPPLAATGRRVGGSGQRSLKFLFHDDNYFASLRNVWTDVRSRAGLQRDFTLSGLTQLYDALMANAALPVSAYDVVAVNYPWIPELAAKDVLSCVEDVRTLERSHAFHRAIWEYAAFEGRQFGVPLYATVEAFVARRDLFDNAGLPLPRTLKDLLRTVRRLHSAKKGVGGVAWNGARGMPIASSFLFFLHDHGGAAVAPRRSAPEVNRRGAWRATLTSPQARATLKFMRALLPFSHPDVLEFNGDRTMYEFMAGRAATAYVWTMRATRFEFDVLSRVKGLAAYLPRPNISGSGRVAPVGGFMLAVPKNLPADRARVAHDAVRWLTSSSTTAKHTRHGLPLVPEFGISSDAELEATSPIVTFVDTLARSNALSTSMRPAIPIYHLMEETLGECIHDALSGKLDDEQALARAATRIELLLRRME